MSGQASVDLGNPGRTGTGGEERQASDRALLHFWEKAGKPEPLWLDWERVEHPQLGQVEVGGFLEFRHNPMLCILPVRPPKQPPGFRRCPFSACCVSMCKLRLAAGMQHRCGQSLTLSCLYGPQPIMQGTTDFILDHAKRHPSVELAELAVTPAAGRSTGVYTVSATVVNRGRLD